MSRDDPRTTSEQTATRLTISFFPAQHEWLKKQAELLDVTVAEVVRRLVLERGGVDMTMGRPSTAPGAPDDLAEEPEAPLPPVPESLPLAVERHHALPAAAAALGISLATAQAWLEADPQLEQAVAEARWRHVLAVQAWLLNIGHGTARGSRQALEKFLEAHHPAYGRVKGELVRRQLRPWCAKVVKLMTEVVGIDTDAGRHILQTFTERLAALQSEAERDFT